MKFDLRKQFYKLFGLLAISEIISVNVLALPVAGPFGELPYLDPVADAEQQEDSGSQRRRSNKRVPFYDDTLLSELLAEALGENQPRYKRVDS